MLIDEVTSFRELASLWPQALMFLTGLGLLYLSISRNYEPLLLFPIGTGIILVNVPFGGLGEEGGLLWMLKEIGLDLPNRRVLCSHGDCSGCGLRRLPIELSQQVGQVRRNEIDDAHFYGLASRVGQGLGDGVFQRL